MGAGQLPLSWFGQDLGLMESSGAASGLGALEGATDHASNNDWRPGSEPVRSRKGSVTMATDDSQQAPFTVDSALTKEEIEQRNLEVVAAHFHNENPDDVDKAIIALYAPDICWEAPNRGVVYTDAQKVKDAYMGIFRTLVFRKVTNLRRFAAGNFVFDDLIAEVHVVGNEMPNMPFPVGTTMNVRLVHCHFELARRTDHPRDRLRECGARRAARSTMMQFRAGAGVI